MTKTDDANVERSQPPRAEARIAELEEEVERLRARLDEYSMVDFETDLASARYFEEFFDRRWRRQLRVGDKPLSLVLVAPHNFDRLRDETGADRASRVFRQLARTVGACATRAGDLAARLDDDVFAVLLSETDREGADKLARKICDTVEAVDLSHPDGQLGVSVGVATAIPEALTGQRTLLGDAESALAAASEAGPGEIVHAE